ncbi:hypothetical protein [Peribacillus frigoritolerans]|uniref:hypothetical protein n=1 Tax=Peribacillus frigoritolerans TaxID=450367 RepID=UPI003015BE5A
MSMSMSMSLEEKQNIIRQVMSAQTLHMFQEQLDYSSKKVEALKNDESNEGAKEFKHHAAMIQDIKMRVETVIESQSSLKETEGILSRLF